MLTMRILLIIFFSFIFSIFHFQSSAQSNLKDTSKINDILDLVTGLDKDSTTLFMDKISSAYELTQDIQSDSLKILYLTKLAFRYQQWNMFSISNNLLSESLLVNKSDTLNLLNARALSIMGNNYFYLGEINNALQSYLKSLNIYNYHSDTIEQASLKNNIGNIYYTLENIPQALNYYKDAEQIFKKTDHTEGLLSNYLNQGNIYFNRENYDKALEYYKQSNQLSHEIQYANGIATSTLNIGLCYYKQGNTIKARSQVFDALALHDKANNKYGMAQAAINLADINLKLNNLNSAMEYAFLAAKNAELSEANQILIDAYKMLSEIFEKESNYKKSLHYLKKYTDLNDSLIAEDTKQRIQNIETKYEIEKQINKNKLLLNQTEIQALTIERQNFVVILFISLFALIIIVFIFVYNRIKNKNSVTRLLKEKNKQISEQNKQLKSLNSSKNKFLSIIAHDLKNPFHTLMSLSSILNNNYSDLSTDEIKEYIGDLEHISINTYQLLENLLNWSRTQTGRIDYNPERILLASIVSKNYELLKSDFDNKGIDVKIDILDEQYIKADYNMINTVFRNLIHNALKFTYEDGEVRISSKSTDDYIEISISDNGVGIAPEYLKDIFSIENQYKSAGTRGEKSTGLGLAICKEFIEKNNGDISVNSEVGSGTTFHIKIPRSKS